MFSDWSQKRARIAQIGWDEVWTRTTQGVNKRVDFARYRIGLPPDIPRCDSSLTVRGNFFFATEDLPRIADLVREHLGQRAEQIVEEAEEICRHRFRLLGFKDLDYGREIDWRLDAVHGKQAPQRAAYRVPYLDFSQVGDHKVTWELNRHQHLVTLAKAWVLTHEGKFAAELVRQWYGWQRANPFPIGINWASTLEVAFRSLSWLWTQFLLIDCPCLPSAWPHDLMQAIGLNGKYIERYLSTFFSPNTHLLGEATALFFIGTLCPQIRDAERWQSLGWRTLLTEAERQVRDDGTYFEQSLYYNVYALDFFLHARTLATINEMRVDIGFDTALEKMLVVLRTLCRAGPPHGFGDDDGGRVFDPRRNRSEHLGDPLAVGAILFDEADLATSASLTEEALWLFGERAVSFFTDQMRPPRWKSVAFEAGGIYVIAAQEGGGQQMIIDAGPQGAGRAGHSHADALNVTVSFNQRPWIVDPGTFEYAGEARNQFRGTNAHNTWTIDRVSQAQPAGAFAWSHLPDVSVEQWVAGESFTFFSGRHTGYVRLPDPVMHRRCVMQIHGRFWMVCDFLEGRGRHHCESTWRFAPDLTLHEIGDAFVAVPAHHDDETPRIALVRIRNSEWTYDLAYGEVSPAYGLKVKAPILRISGDLHLSARCTTVIAPLPATSESPGRLEEIGKRNHSGPATVCGYRYDESQTSHYLFLSAAHESWELGTWASDARALYYSVRDGELEHFVTCNGSFVRMSGETIFSQAQKVERLEWLGKGREEQVFTSDDSVRQYFSPERLRGRDHVLR